SNGSSFLSFCQKGTVFKFAFSRIAFSLNSSNYGGQLYTEADDPLASVFTDFSGTILNQAGLGLYFTPSTFNVYRDSFIDLNDSSGAGVQTVTYTSVPEPSLMLGLSVFGLSLFLGKKIGSSRPSSTKA
ncbi:MAG: hypothetical protein V7K39_01970, partial [Nostoc sp.]